MDNFWELVLPVHLCGFQAQNSVSLVKSGIHLARHSPTWILKEYLLVLVPLALKTAQTLLVNAFKYLMPKGNLACTAPLEEDCNELKVVRMLQARPGLGAAKEIPSQLLPSLGMPS